MMGARHHEVTHLKWMSRPYLSAGHHSASGKMVLMK